VRSRIVLQEEATMPVVLDTNDVTSEAPLALTLTPSDIAD